MMGIIIKILSGIGFALLLLILIILTTGSIYIIDNDTDKTIFSVGLIKD